MEKFFRLFDGLLATTSQPSSLPTPPAGLKWNKLFPFGTRFRSDFPDGKMTFDADFFDAMVRNFEKVPQDLPVDYFHRGQSDDSPVPNDSKVAAGWITQLAIVGDGTRDEDGLWGLFKWNDAARQRILADELRYLSPTFTEAGVDRATGAKQGATLFGAALLNDGFLNDLPKVAASAVPSPSTRTPQRKFMDHAAICKALNLDPEKVTPEMLAAHMAKLGVAPPAGKGGAHEEPDGDEGGGPATTGHEEPDGDEGAVHVHVHAAVEKVRREFSSKLTQAETTAKNLATRMANIESENKALKAERAARDLSSLQEELIRNGNIVPAQKDAVKELAEKTDLETARKFFTAQKAIHLGELQQNWDRRAEVSAKTPAEAEKALAELVSQTMKTANVSEDEAYKRVFNSVEAQPLIELSNQASTKRYN